MISTKSGSGYCVQTNVGEPVKMQSPRPPESGHSSGDSHADGPTGILWKSLAEIPFAAAPTAFVRAELNWSVLILRVKSRPPHLPMNGHFFQYISVPSAREEQVPIPRDTVAAKRGALSCQLQSPHHWAPIFAFLSFWPRDQKGGGVRSRNKGWKRGHTGCPFSQFFSPPWLLESTHLCYILKTLVLFTHLEKKKNELLHKLSEQGWDFLA